MAEQGFESSRAYRLPIVFVLYSLNSMKRVRLTLSGRCKRTLLMFESSRSALAWTVLHGDAGVLGELGNVERVEFEPGDIAEAEWWGCEHARHEGRMIHVDFVVLAKVSLTKNASGALASIHRGWVIDGNVPFHAFSDQNITCVPINVGEPTLALDALMNVAVREC